MPKFERGVYEPNDEVRVFDGSEDDDDVEGSRLPLLIVLALLVLAMFAGVVWLAYVNGVAKGRTETPVLAAQNGPAKIAPQNPGGAQEPYKGFKIYEQPAPPDEDAAATPAANAAAATPAPATTPAPQPVTPPVAKVEAAPVVNTEPAPPPKPAPVAATPAPKPAPVKAVAAATPAPVKAAPVAKPATAPVPAGPATGAPRSLTELAAQPAPAPKAAAAPVKAATGGAYVLQIGAYKSQADADAAWKAYKAKHAALLSGYGPDVQQADLGDKGTWYRLRIAGFSDKDAASAVCDRLKSDGGSCFLGK